jgi:hypothetical protein
MGRALAKPIIFSREKLMGFASLYPSYALLRGVKSGFIFIQHNICPSFRVFQVIADVFNFAH